MDDRLKRTARFLSDVSWVPKPVAEKLEQVGINTLEALAAALPQEVSQVAGIPLSQAERLVSRARRELGLGITRVIDLKRSRLAAKKITTGSRNLDALLGGGIETKMITEFFGEYGSGKTQICHQLAVNVQLPPEKGGLGARAVYIDTEGTFRWERIEAMARRWGLDPEKVLDNILYARAISTDHQISLVDELFELVPKYNIRLVIVDSITGLFRAEYIGREALAERQQKLNRHLHQLMRLAEVYDVAVVITNQVMARPDAYWGENVMAVGGHVLYHAPGIRVWLRKTKGGKRIARIVDAPHIPESETIFRITDEGITD